MRPIPPLARQRFWLFILFVCLAAIKNDVLAQENALLARWTFDEPSGDSAVDVVSGFNGTLVNAVRVPGRIGAGALQFNGVDAYVLVGGINSPLELVGGPYTVCWWQRWDGVTASHQDIISMDDGADYSGGYQAYIFNGTSRMRVLHNNSDQDVWEVTQLPVGGWRFYAVTFDGDTRRFYMDGVLAGTRPTKALVSDHDDPLVFGALRLQNGQFVNFFRGALDDIRVYQRALTDGEIASLGPPPEIVINRQPVGMRIYSGSSLTLSVDAAAVGTTNKLFYQWETNGTAIQDATNNTLVVNSAPSTTNKYRVLITLSDLSKYSDEIEVATVAPFDGRLLLHLDFEQKIDGIFTNESGGFAEIFGTVSSLPGRIGNSAVEFTGAGALRVPAAGTDLELVGSSYTIAWWMKARSPASTSPAQIYTLGDPLTISNRAGYSARLEGLTATRTIRTEHRNGSQPALLGTFRVTTNWQHVAIVFDGLKRSIYTNGVSAGNPVATSLALFGTGQDDLIIGGQGTNRFSAVGAMDDFRIYNYALTTQEIAALVAAPLPPFSLQMTISGSEILLTWPIADSSQFRLESAADIGDINSWNPVSATIQTSGAYYQVRLPKPTSTRFYRVRKL